MLMLVFLVETTLRAVVCANFVSKVLLLRDGNDRLARRFQYIYYLVVVVVIGVLLGVSLLSSSQISCEKHIYSYHWFILDSLDLIQSVLITISALYLFRHVKAKARQMPTETSDQDIIMSVHEKRQLKCLMAQTKIISAFYLCYVLSDFIFQGVGNAVFDLTNDFKCVNGTVLIPMNDSGAAYLLT